MAVCVAVAKSGVLHLDTLSDVSLCQYLLISNSDFLTVKNVNTLFSTYFDFDFVLFDKLLGAFLVSFIAGHYLGKVVAALRKV